MHPYLFSPNLLSFFKIMTVQIAENINPEVLRVFIVRHGQTDHNVQKILQGHLDIDINDTGREQAQLVANTFENIKIDCLVSSDLIRCQNTIKPFLSHHEVEPKITSNLRERDMGEVQGMYLKDAREKYGDNFRNMGEQPEQFISRVEQEWNLILKQQQCLNVAVCTHGGVITTFVNYLHDKKGYSLGEGLTREKLKVPYNTSVTVIDINKGTKNGKIQIFGNTDHLGAQFEVKEQALR